MINEKINKDELIFVKKVTKMSTATFPPPFQDDTIIAVAMGTFDLMSGVKPFQKWQFVDGDFTLQLESLFRMILSTVHRQKGNVFDGSLITTLEIASSNWFVINTVFHITTPEIANSKPRETYYSISIIFDSTKFDKSQQVIACATYWIKQLVNAAKFLIVKNEKFQKMAPLVRKCVEEILTLQHIGIKQLSSYFMDPQEIQFYALLLTAHLKAGMNTIFEVTQLSDCEKYFNFLAHFTIPEFLKYSSNEVRKQPNMFLHLQIVEKQNFSPEEILFQSPGERCLIRMADRQVYITPNYQTQVKANAEYMKIRVENSMTDDQETKRKNLKSRTVSYKPRSLSNPCSIALLSVKLTDEVKIETTYLICQQRLAVIIRNAVTLISLVDDLLLSSGKDEITIPQRDELIKLLKLKDKDDFDAIVPIAHIYDEDIYKKVPQLKETKSIFSGQFLQ